MKRTDTFSIAAVAMLMACLGLLIIGCENTQSGSTIEISPNNITVSTTNGSVVFTAIARNDIGTATPSTVGQAGVANSFVFDNSVSNTVLRRPLVWSVSDPALGRIAGSQGLTAIYVPNQGASGTQLITARDQGEGSGVANINQTP